MTACDDPFCQCPCHYDDPIDDDFPSPDPTTVTAQAIVDAGDPMLGQIVPEGPHMTFDESTQRMRPMTDDEIAELRAKVRVMPVHSPLDTSDALPYDSGIGSMIDTEVGE
jgi:hypothetical protein